MTNEIIWILKKFKGKKEKQKQRKGNVYTFIWILFADIYELLVECLILESHPQLNNNLSTFFFYCTRWINYSFIKGEKYKWLKD